MGCPILSSGWPGVEGGCARRGPERGPLARSLAHFSRRVCRSTRAARQPTGPPPHRPIPGTGGGAIYALVRQRAGPAKGHARTMVREERRRERKKDSPVRKSGRRALSLARSRSFPFFFFRRAKMRPLLRPPARRPALTGLRSPGGAHQERRAALPTHRPPPRATAPTTPSIPPPLPPLPPFSLFVIGSLNADLVLTVPRLPAPGETLAASSLASFPGGKGGNQAVAAARLGWPTLMVGQVGGGGDGGGGGGGEGGGGDQGARLLLSSLAAASVDTRYVDTLPHVPTGTAVIMVQEGSGENSIVIVGGANGEEGAWLEGAGLKGALGDVAAAGVGGEGPPLGALLLQREIPDTVNVAAAAAARAAGVPVILDAGGEDAPLPPALLACVDVVSPNETELARLTGVEGGCEDEGGAIRAATALLDASPGLAAVLVKRGAAGSILVEAGDPVGSAPTITVQAAAPVEKVVDTTGAGDCFTAAYAVAMLRGLAPVARLRYASAAAGLCVQAKGAGPSMPGHEEVMLALRGWEGEEEE